MSPKKVIILLLVMIVVTSFPNARAARAFEVAPGTSEKETEVLEAISVTHQNWADLFGCGLAVTGRFSDNGARTVLEYTPKSTAGKTYEQLGKAWKRLFVVVSYSLSGDPQKDKDLVQTIEKVSVSRFNSSGDMIQFEPLPQDNSDYPAVFFEHKADVHRAVGMAPSVTPGVRCSHDPSA
jgi:hypothetical protein